MNAIVAILVIVALMVIIVGHAFWTWNIWQDSLEKKKRAQDSVTIETVCDACGHSMTQTGAYSFRKKYLCGKCLKKAISLLEKEGNQ